ncbi:MAG: ribosome maturation factor RimP [Pseudomonadales bacterium]|nr:ribosome maturation factor RimP [Pseudomonadales bacterium]MDP6469638.1 ribosome maturation factor RimP [Pseudomonadales bacterium]MDP6827479.1 ribosome maturation factor RimP [Pseudomonadales bacterium]
MNRTERQIDSLVQPTIEALGCSVWGVEYLSQGRHSRLRIYIDKPDGVSVDDCAEISRQVGHVLDVEDVIRQEYTLEVSSPGFDRILFNERQFQDNVGETVDVRLNFPFEGRKHFVGVLTAVEQSEAHVQIENDEYLLPLENVQRARVVPRFD